MQAMDVKLMMGILIRTGIVVNQTILVMKVVVNFTLQVESGMIYGQLIHKLLISLSMVDLMEKPQPYLEQQH